MFGVNGSEFVVLVVIAIIVLGPEKLPQYAEQLGRAVRSVRDYLAVAKERVREEAGVEWEDLDPRRFDPRRIIQDALADEPGQASMTPTAQVERPAPPEAP